MRYGRFQQSFRYSFTEFTVGRPENFYWKASRNLLEEVLRGNVVSGSLKTLHSDVMGREIMIVTFDCDYL